MAHKCAYLIQALVQYGVSISKLHCVCMDDESTKQGIGKVQKFMEPCQMSGTTSLTTPKSATCMFSLCSWKQLWQLNTDWLGPQLSFEVATGKGNWVKWTWHFSAAK